jgi:hypothetical protein
MANAEMQYGDAQKGRKHGVFGFRELQKVSILSSETGAG